MNLEAQVKNVGELRCLLGSGLTKGGVTVSITATVERTSVDKAQEILKALEQSDLSCSVDLTLHIAAWEHKKESK